MKYLWFLLFVGVVICQECMLNNCAAQVNDCKRDNVCKKQVHDCAVEKLNNLGDGSSSKTTSKAKGSYDLCMKNANYKKTRELYQCQQTYCSFSKMLLIGQEYE
ncbi:hypothetical protein pb186bvf_002918 [Paramecium bursaria]